MISLGLRLAWVIVIITVVKSVDLSSRTLPHLILPGFGNTWTDYSNTKYSHHNIIQSLTNNGVEVVDTVPIIRSDWFHMIRSAPTVRFWQSRCTPHDMYKFYISKSLKAIFRLHQETGKPVILIAHSAGGWLARAVVGDGNQTILCNNHIYSICDLVAGLVTLGTPHYPLLPSRFDPTRGALRYVHHNYPSLKENKVPIVTIAGAAVRGKPGILNFGTLDHFAAYNYKHFIENHQHNIFSNIGDGLVPVSAALLPNTLQIVMRDVWHGISSTPTKNWYGSLTVVNEWFPLVHELFNVN